MTNFQPIQKCTVGLSWPTLADVRCSRNKYASNLRLKDLNLQPMVSYGHFLILDHPISGDFRLSNRFPSQVVEIKTKQTAQVTEVCNMLLICGSFGGPMYTPEFRGGPPPRLTRTFSRSARIRNTLKTKAASVGKFTLWLFNIAMENGPFIVDFPSYKPPFMGDFPWLC